MKEKYILVFNIGSSSVKFSLFDIKNISNKIIYGKIDNINNKKSNLVLNIKNNIKKIYFNNSISYKESIDYIINNILKENNLKEKILSVGHRVVHGGKIFKKSIIINENVLKNIENLIKFSPIHNYINLLGIKESIKKLPNIVNNNVAVFDTSFFYDLPYVSYLYAIPYKFYKNYDIKRYGAHGISNNYVLNRYSEIYNINKNNLNLIICHLGNGSSISVIKNGKCIDTSMGLSPLEGLVMGNRSGDIDPYVIFFLNKILNININDIENILLKKSGLLGLSNKSNDIRIIENLYKKNDKNSIIAINVFCYKLIKYIGSYIAALNDKLDALIFTGGIGENSNLVREISIKLLSNFEIILDKNKNDKNNFYDYKIITSNKSKIKSIVIKSDEDKFIAKESLNLIFNK